MQLTQQHRIALYIVTTGVMVWVIALLYMYAVPTPTDTLRAKLLREFEDAYEGSVAPATTYREYTLVAQESEVTLITSTTTRVWTYNGTVPGPTLRVRKGEGVRITFINKLPQETTIHWHGVRVPNAMDGVPGVTQEPVPPGGTFVYEFIPKDAGTFWYHPHVRSSEQVERGLYGAFIVEDDATQFDDDIVLMVDDWRITQNAQVHPRFNTPMDLMHDGRWGNVVTVNGSSSASVAVSPQATVLLRFINPSNARVYRPDFGALTAYVVAIDGMYVKEPFPYSGFDIAPGNRMDVAIQVPSAAGARYTVVDTFTQTPFPLFTLTANKPPLSRSHTVKLPRNKRVPGWEGADTLPIDALYILDARRGASGMREGGFAVEWTINGKTFAESEPITLKKKMFQTIRFRNDSSRLHPMHLHGQFFKVLTRNGAPSQENFFRDTVLLYPKETVDLGIVPLDEGTWVNHCHILEHAESGMMTTVLVE